MLEKLPETGLELGREGGVVPGAIVLSLGNGEYGLSAALGSISTGAFCSRLGGSIGGSSTEVCIRSEACMEPGRSSSTMSGISSRMTGSEKKCS